MKSAGDMKQSFSIPRIIIKRDGRHEPFDSERITYAIFRALRAVGKPCREKAAALGTDVVTMLEDGQGSMHPTVEEVQDIVEKVLFMHQEFDAARACILYRHQHRTIRDAKEMFSNIDLVDSYLNLEDWRVKESANSSYSLQGLNQHISTLVNAQYWLGRIYPPEISEAHKSEILHIHDLGFLSVYCVGSGCSASGLEQRTDASRMVFSAKKNSGLYRDDFMRCRTGFFRVQAKLPRQQRNRSLFFCISQTIAPMACQCVMKC
jgi:transcriptional regulator NrdR family protein